MKIQSIQGLRGVAVAAVVLFHLNIGTGSGFLGVDVFFVISGYVITMQIGKRLDGGSFRFLEFYKRRFQRLFLPLAFVVVTTALLSFFLLGYRAFIVAFQTGLSALAGFSNLVIHRETGDYFGSTSSANPLLHTWSLSVEEQFYFLLPILLFIIAGTARINWARWAFSALGLVGFFSLVAWLNQDAFSYVPRLDLIFSFYSPVIRLWEFAAGAMVYLAQSSHLKLLSKIPRSVAWLFVFLLFVLFQFPKSETFVDKEWMTILAVVVTALLLASVTSSHFGNPLLESRLLVWLGNRSYSVYLWHWPVYVLFGFLSNWNWNGLLVATVLITTLFLAAFTYTHVESGLGKKLMSVHLRFSAPTITSAAVAVTLMLGAMYPSFFPMAVAQEKNRSANYFEHAPGCGVDVWCMNRSALDADQIGEFPVYLVGDSNAQMMYPGLVRATEEMGRDLVFLTHSSCPPVPGGFTQNSSSCLSYKEVVLSFLDSAPPGIVVLGLTNAYLSDSTEAESFFTSFADSIDAFASSVESYGHTFLLIEPIPQFKWSASSYIGPELMSRLMASKEIRIPGPNGLEYQAFSRAMSQLAEKVQVFPTRSTLCPMETCILIENGKFVWRDSNHITAEASYRFTERWVQALSLSK